MEPLQEAYRGVVNGELPRVENAVRAALEQGVAAREILDGTLIPAMAEVGHLFEGQQYFLPELIVAGAAMKAGVAILRPQLVDAGSDASAGKVLLGTVEGDLHDIGKNLVAMMLEGAGFEVVDIGVDAPVAKFVEAAKANVDVVGISALLTGTMPAMKRVVEAVGKAGLRPKIKVMIGGAPVTQDYADAIGADGYAPDAASAVRLAKRLIGTS
jgi:5-methyltetrahydrofolate--homocysteine methyltransferase